MTKVWETVKKNGKYIFWLVIAGFMLCGLVVIKAMVRPNNRGTGVVKIEGVDKKDFVGKAEREAGDIDKKIRARRPKPTEEPSEWVRNFLKEKTEG